MSNIHFLLPTGEILTQRQKILLSYGVLRICVQSDVIDTCTITLDDLSDHHASFGLGTPFTYRGVMSSPAGFETLAQLFHRWSW